MTLGSALPFPFIISICRRGETGVIPDFGLAGDSSLRFVRLEGLAVAVALALALALALAVGLAETVAEGDALAPGEAVALAAGKTLPVGLTLASGEAVALVERRVAAKIAPPETILFIIK